MTRRSILVLFVTCLVLIPVAFSQRSPPDLGKIFSQGKACFLLYDATSGEILRFGAEQCQKRLSPCSTFKIPNSLIGLEAVAIEDEHTVFPWDGTEHRRKVLNRGHDLSSAIKYSVVWYYQELARRIGLERMQQQVDAISYGNQDLSGGLTRFWLNSTLKISAEEQIGFLRRFYGGELPFGEHAQATVRRILVLERRGDTVLSGKTGGTAQETYSLGWFVGRLERDGYEYFFAANVESAGGVSGSQVKGKVLQVLEELGLLPRK